MMLLLVVLVVVVVVELLVVLLRFQESVFHVSNTDSWYSLILPVSLFHVGNTGSAHLFSSPQPQSLTIFGLREKRGGAYLDNLINSHRSECLD